MKKFKLPNIPKMRKLFQYRLFNLIFSFAVAIIGWMVVVTIVSPNYDEWVNGVPVDFDTGVNTYRNQGFMYIGTDPMQNININVNGDRSLVASLDSNDFIVTVRYDNVTAPGSYDLPIEVSKTNNLDNFDIISIQPSTVTMQFDTVVRKELPITTDIQDVVIADGYISGKANVTAEVVTIEGPAVVVDSIVSATATFKSEQPLDERTTFTSDIILLDENGYMVDSEYVIVDRTTVDMTLPVSKMGEVTLDIQFSNVPPYFDTDILEYTLSTSTLSIAGEEELVDSTENLVIGYIDLATFTLGAVYERPVVLPEGLENLDNVENITITFDTSSLGERTVNVEDITIVNLPSDKEVTIESAEIQGVHLIGNTSRLETLNQNSIVGEIQASDITVVGGNQNVPVTIVIPSSTDIFAIGEYTAVVNVE